MMGVPSGAGPLRTVRASFSPAAATRVRAVLGPTNTGKTHLAIERLLAHSSGIIGFPLRLLARENYERMVAAKGAAAVALITGEEKIVPPGARWFSCTVEAMPLDQMVEFVAVDEIQLCADPDRGHVFTDRLLRARGLVETMFLGAETIRPLMRRLVPGVEIETRPRLSSLAYLGASKLTRLPPRSAIVAFSATEVYAIAELIRRRRGGCAVVMGQLSPRTRNAQVALYQEREVDYLVATDAIGMGLNLTIRRVIFTALRKFDGTQTRDLTSQEVKQIAGRAGRYGKHEEGIVSVMADAGSLSFIRTMLAAPPDDLPDLRPQVQPDADIIQAVAAEIGSDSLFGVLARIRRAVLRRDDPNYRLANMEQAFAIATALEGVTGLTLAQRWVYAMCPVDDRDNGIQRLVHWAADHAADRPVIPPGTG
ncbi:helicase-related protein, partial [Nguyenibacter vanlangensis]